MDCSEARQAMEDYLIRNSDDGGRYRFAYDKAILDHVTHNITVSEEKVVVPARIRKSPLGRIPKDKAVTVVVQNESAIKCQACWDYLQELKSKHDQLKSKPPR